MEQEIIGNSGLWTTVVRGFLAVGPIGVVALAGLLGWVAFLYASSKRDAVKLEIARINSDKEKFLSKEEADDVGSSCFTTGCPEISKVSVELACLTEEVKRDREDRRAHRDEVRTSILRIHERIDEQGREFRDQFVPKVEFTYLEKLVNHFMTEATQVVSMLNKEARHGEL